MAALELVSARSSDLNWRAGLPVLSDGCVVLRELRLADAPALYRIVRSPEVARYMWPPPGGVDGFKRFIKWTHAERAHERYVCFGIVPFGSRQAAGLFELRPTQPGFFRGELGFFLDPACWGTGLFSAAARLMLDFAFDVIGVQRIEARVATDNVRGNHALRKLGAVREGLLRGGFMRDGQLVDQYLWAFTAPPDDHVGTTRG
jgi:[ribosomal protein S5]-alanine N-acetyltransferase